MIRIIADDNIPFLNGVLEPFAEVTYLPGKFFSGESIRKADALLVRTVTQCNSKLLEGSSVRFIGSASAGYDHVDTLFCERNGICWEYAPGSNAPAVSQYVCSALLSISNFQGESLRKKTIGIIGVGNVGTEVKRMAGILGMNVLLNDPPRERNEGPGDYLPFSEVVSQSDFLTLHVPLQRSGTDKTFHLVNHESLSMMKKNSWLINTSRGEVVDSGAIKEMRKKRVNPGLVFDVWENEPFIDTDLIPLVHLATPHIAGYSLEGKARGTSMIVRALGRYFHLPLTGWFPESLQTPERCSISVEGKGKTIEEILTEIILKIYPIHEDDHRFREDPAKFETLRLLNLNRREFSACQINSDTVSAEILTVLQNLGFSTG